MVTIRDILGEISLQFKSIGLDTPELDARLLVQYVLNLRHEDMLLNPQKTITEAENKKLMALVERRMAREPVSRILGTRAFWTSEFIVSPDTLDPRADSETVIEAVVQHADKTAPIRILDLGTGTGCLLLSLLQEFPKATGIGVDISAGAVDIARRNGAALQLSSQSLFIIQNWDTLNIEGKFDVVVSNPPYIVDAEIAGLAPEVRQYDPRRALAGGADGLDCYRVISRLLPNLLTPNGKVFFEIGATQAESVKEILAEAGFYVLHTVIDIAGHPRCVVAQREG